MGKYVAIVGSRERLASEAVCAFVASLPADSVVISGGAVGPDRWAEEAALARGLRTLVFPPDMNGAITAGQRTRRYHARNQEIVDAADELVAFVSSERRGGTEDTIRRAERKGIPILIL